MTNPGNTVRIRSRNGGRGSVYEANMWAQKWPTGLYSGNGVLPNSTPDMNVRVGGSSTNPDIVIAQNPAGYKIVLDLVSQQTILITAPASNSRISCIVAYTDDLSVASATTATTGTPASCGLIVVNGTSAASPVAPNDTAIRAAITTDGATGSQASYGIIATLTIASTTTTITSGMITPILGTPAISGINLIDATIPPVKMGFSLPVQRVVSRPTAMTTGSTAIPLDDTIPQITEGTEYMSLTITPLFATSTLIIEVNAMIANTLAAKNMTGAIFKSGVADALAVTTENNNAASGSQFLALEASIISGSTSPQTFTFRAGSNDTVSPGTTTFNGRAGARLFGAIPKSFIKITEYKA